MMRALARLLRAERGTAATEFALVLPALLLLLLGIMEFGRFMWVDNTLRHAVQEGARCAALNCCDSAGNACTSPEDLAAQRASGLHLTATDFVLDLQSCGKRLRAGASGSGVQYDFMVGDLLGLAGVDVTLTAEACFPTLDR